MRHPQRPVWSEGMLLSPQHFQAMDRFQEALIGARVGAVAPTDWGVTALEIDGAALAAGQLRILRFAGILPDGLPLAFDDPENGPAPREVAPHFPVTARMIEVFLAVPREREAVPSVSEEGGAATARFLAATRTLHDATAPDATVPVRLARPNAVLLFGDEPHDDHEAIKVAEVVRAGSGQLALQDSYVPPCLRVSVASRLHADLRDLLARAIAKQRELAETRRHREAGEVAAADLVRLLQLLVLNAHIPELAHLADTGEAAPRDAYLTLARLTAQLCAFRGDDPSAVPKLLHTDLRATFGPLVTRLREYLGGMAAQQYLTVPLEQRAGGIFLARLQDERLLRSQLYLIVRSDQPEAVVVEQLPRRCKIASAAEIQGLLQAAATGLPLQVVHRPPPQLPVHPGAVYFALVPGDRYWQGIVNGRNAALYLPPPFDPARTKLELLAVPAEAQPAAPSPQQRI